MHYSGSASLDAATVSAALGELGHWGQVTIVWFSIGVAVWQLVTVGTQLLAAGDISTVYLHIETSRARVVIRRFKVSRR